MNLSGYDKALIGKCLARAEERCMPYAVYWVHNVDTAEEICQDACLEILQYIKTHSDFREEDIMRLMYRIVKCKIINYLKKASTQKEVLMDIHDLEADSADDCDKYDWMVEVLYQKIQMLKPVEQKIISGRLEGKSNETLAAELGKSVHAVECIYSRTIKKLKKLVHTKASEMKQSNETEQ